MKVTSLERIETCPPQTDIVTEYLQKIDWNAESYPLELLVLSDDERQILQQTGDGMSLHDIAGTNGLLYPAAISRHYAAEGKRDALDGLDKDLISLSPKAQRVVILNSLFGKRWNNGTSAVVSTEPEVILTNVPQLDEMLGYKWRRCPQLSVIPIDTIKDRVERYDKSLGLRWRNSPVILTQSPDIIESRVLTYDKSFGTSWQVKPTILTNKTNTVIASARAINTVGITQENTPPGPYFGLLCTTVANKRRKAAFIRHELLGHKQVRIHETKLPLAEIVRERQRQTPADKELEAREIEEYKVFVRHIGAKKLAQSTVVIEKWARAHGYPISKSVREPRA